MKVKRLSQQRERTKAYGVFMDSHPLADIFPLMERAFVTVDGAVMLIREKTGIPIPKSRLHQEDHSEVAS